MGVGRPGVGVLVAEDEVAVHRRRARRTARRLRRRAPRRRAGARGRRPPSNASNAPECTLPAWRTTRVGRPSPAARASRSAGSSIRPWPSAAHRLGRAEAEVAQHQVDRVVPLLARPARARRASRPGRASATSQPARAQHRVAAGGEAGEVGHRAAGHEAHGAPRREAEQVEHPRLGDVLDRGVRRGDGAQPGVLVPGAGQPVGGHRGGVGAADDEAEEPAGRHGGQAGLAGLGEQVDDVVPVGRAVRQRAAEPLDDGGHVRLRRHRPVGQGVEPAERVGVGAVERPCCGIHPAILVPSTGDGRGAGGAGLAGPRGRARRPGRRVRAAAPRAPEGPGQAPRPRLPLHLLLPAARAAAAVAPGFRRGAGERRGVRRPEGVRRRSTGLPRVRRVAAAAARVAAPAAQRHRRAARQLRLLRHARVGDGAPAPTRPGTTGRCGSAARAPTPSSSRTGSPARTSTRTASSRRAPGRSTPSTRRRTTAPTSSSRPACTPGWTSTSTPSGSPR